MPNSNYTKGRRFEYEIKKHYEALGAHVMRSSGSHGCYDLAVFDHDGTVILIQCKVTKDPKDVPQLTKAFDKDIVFPIGTYSQMLVIKIMNQSGYLVYIPEK